MRYVIWSKDDFFQSDNKRIDMGVNVINFDPDKIYPVVVGFEFVMANPPIGWVSDVAIIDGNLSGEIGWVGENWKDEDMDNEIWRIGGCYKNVIRAKTDESVVVSSELVCVSIMALVETPGYTGYHAKPEA